MTIKDEFKKMPKEVVYDMYLSLVYNCMPYDGITRTKMLEEILDEFKTEKYLMCLCTKRELDFLDYIQSHKLNKQDLEKYDWEIDTLNRKCIFSRVSLDVFEEQKENVKTALKDYKEFNYNIYELMTIIIGLVRVNGSIPLMALKGMITSLNGVQEDMFDSLLGNPLLHFYCDFTEDYIPSLKENVETIYYRAYYEWLDDLDEARKEFGMSGTIPVNLEEYIDMFYYGVPIKKPKVKKMYETVKMLPYFGFFDLDIARLLNYRGDLEILIDDDKTIKIINEGLDETPCAAMNGHTPNQWMEKQKKKEVLETKFTRVPQNNAHLCKNAANEYYEVYFALLEFTNNHYNVNSNIKKIYRQLHLDQNDILPIDEYLWSHREILDEFIEANEYSFDEKKLKVVRDFKNAITSEKFVVVGFERDYTEILLTGEGKIYMVKGINVNLEEVIGMYELPVLVKTTLLMFDDKITFCSMICSYAIDLGPDWAEMIYKEKEEAMRYYHL